MDVKQKGFEYYYIYLGIISSLLTHITDNVDSQYGNHMIPHHSGLMISFHWMMMKILSRQKTVVSRITEILHWERNLTMEMQICYLWKSKILHLRTSWSAKRSKSIRCN